MLWLIYQWLDLLWLPAALLAVHRGQRLMAAGFVLACVFSLRMQIELMASLGFPQGILGFLNAGLYNRGLITYSLVTALFLVLAYLSPNTKGAIFLAASISLYILSFCTSMLVMAL